MVPQPCQRQTALTQPSVSVDRFATEAVYLVHMYANIQAAGHVSYAEAYQSLSEPSSAQDPSSRLSCLRIM